MKHGCPLPIIIHKFQLQMEVYIYLIQPLFVTVCDSLCNTSLDDLVHRRLL
jgi:hypothetical protein